MNEEGLEDNSSMEFENLEKNFNDKTRDQSSQANIIGNAGGVNLFEVKSFQTDKKLEDFVDIKPKNVEKDAEEKQQEDYKAIYDTGFMVMNPFKGALDEAIYGKTVYEEKFIGEGDLDLKDLLIVEDSIMVQINELDPPKIQKYKRNYKRSEAIHKAKLELPINSKEIDLIDSIRNNLVTIVCGTTGSGKSTQLPQMLLESGFCEYGLIGVTQPRRLAAISLAQRVAREIGDKRVGNEVGYQVRFESSKLSDNLNQKFMTDGILLNEMMSGFMLSNYGVIIIDEAHERKINSDLLLGLLSRVVNIRAKLALKERQENPKSEQGYKIQPLRLVIMSATLKIDDFIGNKYLFPQKINVINVESRQFSVKTYFAKKTEESYFDNCLKRTKQIHSQLPQGGILVFLTGEEEIKYFCKMLEIELYRECKNRAERKQMAEDKEKRVQKRLADRKEEDFEEKDYDIESEPEDIPPNKKGENDSSGDSDEEGQDEEDYTITTNLKEKLKLDKHFMQELKKTKDEFKEDDKKNKKGGNSESEEIEIDFQIYPLYSKLSLEEQQRIFDHKDPNKRLIVVSTNIAETSLTIPDVKYVVDSGKEKQKIFDQKFCTSKFVINFTSKSSAEQRTGIFEFLK